MHYDPLLFLVTLVARLADEDVVFPCFCESSRPMPPRYVAISRFVSLVFVGSIFETDRLDGSWTFFDSYQKSSR